METKQTKKEITQEDYQKLNEIAIYLTESPVEERNKILAYFSMANELKENKIRNQEAIAKCLENQYLNADTPLSIEEIQKTINGQMVNSMVKKGASIGKKIFYNGGKLALAGIISFGLGYAGKNVSMQDISDNYSNYKNSIVQYFTKGNKLESKQQ